MNKEKFLIWSNEHQGWWVAGRSGYTQELHMAGEYSFNDACEICHDANQHLNVTDVPNEAMIPVGCMAKFKR